MEVEKTILIYYIKHMRIHAHIYTAHLRYLGSKLAKSRGLALASAGTLDCSGDGANRSCRGRKRHPLTTPDTPVTRPFNRLKNQPKAATCM